MASFMGGDDDELSRLAKEATAEKGGGYLLTKGENILGHPTEVKATGTGSLSGGAASALPAPGGPGGVGGGFLGGSRGQQGAGPGGEVSASKVVDLLTKFFGPTGALGTRGSVGGSDQRQESNQSLSDRLRSELGLTGDVPLNLPAGVSGNSALNAGGPSSPMSELDVFRENFPPGGGFGTGEATQVGPGSFSTGGAGVVGSEGLTGLGGVMAGIGGTAAGIGLAQAIAAKDPLGIATNLAGLYGVSVPYINAAFGTALPQLSQVAVSALEAVAPELAASLASSIGPVVADVAATVGSAPAAMLMGPYMVAKAIQAYQALGPDRTNAYQLGRRVENIYEQLPGEISQLHGIPGITGQLTANSTPEEAADILKQLNSIQTGFQEGGWENYAATGQTGVGSVGVGNMKAKLPQVQTALDKMDPYLQQLDLTRLRAEDILGRAGWTPDQIKARTGRYIGPQEWAMNLNNQDYQGGDQHPVWQNFNPTFNAQFRPEVSGTAPGHLVPGAAVGGEGGSWTGPDTWVSDYVGRQTPFGQVDPAMWEALSQIAPGDLEQGLMKYLQPYGGVNPGFQSLGFGQGLTPPESPSAQNPQQSEQASKLVMQALQALGGGSAAQGPTGEAGVLSDAQKRLLGLIA